MRNLMFALGAAVSLNGLAIEFITEAQVAQALRADNVIEVSKYAVEPLLSGDCAAAAQSRSARAYVVKSGHQASLYVTPSGLRGLRRCGDL